MKNFIEKNFNTIMIIEFLISAIFICASLILGTMEGLILSVAKLMILIHILPLRENEKKEKEEEKTIIVLHI